MSSLCSILILTVFAVCHLVSSDVSPIVLQNQATTANLTLNRTSLDPLYVSRTLNTEFNLTGTVPAGYSLSILVNDERIAVVTENATLDLPQITDSVIEGGFAVEGKRLGLGKLSFYLHLTGQDPQTGELLKYDFEVVVLRSGSLEEYIFEYGLIALAVILYIGFGCIIDLKIIWKVLKRPIGPIIGFLSQFVIMPLIGFGLAEALGLDPAFAFGLVTMACSPGGGSSNVWVNLLGGDLDLSIAMTSVSTLSALFMMPAWLYLLGTQFIDSSRVNIPYSDIALTLLYIIIPCAVGVGIKKCSSKAAKFLAKCIHPFSFIFVLYILAFGTYVNWYMFEVIEDEILIIPAAFLLPCLGYLAGFLVALLLRRDKKVAITIAIETGVQNATIPILVLQRSFPQPDGDLAAIMPVAAAYFYSIPIIIVWGLLFMYRKYTGNDPLEVNAKEGDIEKTTKSKNSVNGSISVIGDDSSYGTYEKNNPGFTTEL